MNDLIQRVPDLRGQLRDQLERRLRLGIYPDDVRLLEHGVAREFSVSRTPAREALAMLAREGVLERVGRGYRRARFSAEDIRQVFEARRRLEPFAVRLVATKMTTAEKAALRQALKELERQVGDAHGYMEALAAMRRPLFQPCGNEHLIRLMSVYEAQIGYMRTKTLLELETRKVSLAANKRLVKSVCAGEQDAAEQEMAELLALTEQASMKLF